MVCYNKDRRFNEFSLAFCQFFIFVFLWGYAKESNPVWAEFVVGAEAIANTVTANIKYYDYENLNPSHFEIRNGNRVTLFQDAHCEGDYPAQIVKDDGNIDFSYTPQNCYEQIYQAILDAKRFVYITGWSVDTKISLLRRKPIFMEEGSDASPPAGKMTIGELLKYKATQGVRVLLHVWDEALSVNIGGFSTAGIMCTWDEETKKYFEGTGVECKLSYRTGSTKDNQFLWTHHQKSVIVDSAPMSGSLYSSTSAMRTSSYMSGFVGHDCTAEVQQMLQNIALSESDYAKRDKDGNRYVISSFMTCEHTYKKVWDDTNTWCLPHSVSIFRPVPPPGWFSLGDIAQRHLEHHPHRLTKVMVVKEPPLVPGEPPLLACPTGYGQIWPMKKPFPSKTGSVVFWEPIAPEGYEALGFVVTATMTPPPLDIIRCVHRDALEKAHAAAEEDHRPLWRNKGKVRNALGGPEVSLWSIIPSGSGLITGTFTVRGGHKLPPAHLQDIYWALKTPPLGTDVCPKPSDKIDEQGNLIEDSTGSYPVPKLESGKRRIIAFVGGLDLTYGRWDTPSHPLFRTLDAEHQSDFLHGWGVKQCFGPREPWHDIHAKFEGPVARDVMTNFEQRWRKQAKSHLYHVGREFISIQEEEIHDDDGAWSCRLVRSIDPFSADIPYTDNSIQHSYVTAIRNAKRFIYIENQYFMGSSKHWLTEKDTGCVNLIPYEIANRIAQSIATDYVPMVAYIMVPLYPEGYPMDGAIQEQLRWQWNTMCMMYDIIRTALIAKGRVNSPMDFLKFLCVGQREDVALSRAERSDAPNKSNESILFVSRRVPIYVHSKLMIIDDEYIILGSANINERSMAGDRDSEICVESWQPKFINTGNPRGGVHKFRMSLWAEHVGASFPEFLHPNSPDCVKRITEVCDKNWDIFTGPDVVDMHSHLMRYPIRWNSTTIVPDPEHFPDTKAPVMGKSSLTMPDLLTC